MEHHRTRQQHFIHLVIAIFSGILLSVSLCSAVNSDDENAVADEVVYVVISQPNDYHADKAEKFRHHFNEQLLTVTKENKPRVYFTHLDMTDNAGAWTLFPLIEELTYIHKEKEFRWAFICEEDTTVNISGLNTLLENYKFTENVFLGRRLNDDHSTIIHHFYSPKGFYYPDLRAGFVMSISLLLSLQERLTSEKLFNDFSIDPKHELAKFLWREGEGVPLVAADGFCSVAESGDKNRKCVTSQEEKFPHCGLAVDKDDLFVAVKTCHKFHDSRIPIVKSTWGKEADLIEYYSEVADPSIPTINLGIPNTERGHCGKTMAIIKRIERNPTLNRLKWILIADDDTIINLARLRKLLACYNFRQPVALGERYGYGQSKNLGYDYITMGGGLVLSKPALRMLAEQCSCWSDDAPDDMTLGMCLKNIGIPATHSKFFHQARPNDYSQRFLENQIPVSFHKHWNNDPYKVYADLTAKVKGESHADTDNVDTDNVVSQQVDGRETHEEL